ncbi:A/G-specific adenine glycosylase [Sphingomonas cavernae]|uniref:Adenine DNA glycosylase n=1 Tax=Sphingomonas cavernae TaxID=2320861 RepID=A0A418WKY8_9SPHN|nr:A/G-specific adenine glycosylase [Sphingomonas cavernae]RJF90509.1 A/G-specific adenine glycosylase [Sphingomonas cavernae]
MPVDMPLEERVEIPAMLLRWYDRHARALPWRSPPGVPAPSPYRVWLSEVMLQQTTVAAAWRYFEAFTTRWPTVEALAAADDADMMAAWAGLGYYARARNMLACARTVTRDHGGRFPDNEAGLRALPGIGAYTAAAIAAIAFDRRAVVVDANVERVVARLFAVEEPLPAAKSLLHGFADSITPSARAGDFAQAMMDLGATLCSPRNPACALCPLNEPCAARRAGTPERFPAKAAKKARPRRFGTIFWVEQDEHVLLVRREKKGLLGGMRALPTGPWQAETPGLAEAPVTGEWGIGATEVSHVFTHFALDLAIARLQLEKGCAEKLVGEWWPIDRLDTAGLPTVFAKAARKVLEDRNG